VEVHGRRAVLRRVRLGDHPRVGAVTFEQLRLEYQCPEKLARQLFDDCAKLRAELAATQEMHSLEQALRARTERKTTWPPARRVNRDREED